MWSCHIHTWTLNFSGFKSIKQDTSSMLQIATWLTNRCSFARSSKGGRLTNKSSPLIFSSVVQDFYSQNNQCSFFFLQPLQKVLIQLAKSRVLLTLKYWPLGLLSLCSPPLKKAIWHKSEIKKLSWMKVKCPQRAQLKPAVGPGQIPRHLKANIFNASLETANKIHTRALDLLACPS